MNRVVIGIGSNINPDKNIPRALDLLSHKTRLCKQSSLVTTKPIGFSDQNDFVNGAVLVETTCTISELNSYLKEVEKKCNRVKTENKNGPRTIDLDVIVWNDRLVDDDYYSRDFLQKAVKELIPDFRP